MLPSTYMTFYDFFSQLGLWYRWLRKREKSSIFSSCTFLSNRKCFHIKLFFSSEKNVCIVHSGNIKRDSLLHHHKRKYKNGINPKILCAVTLPNFLYSPAKMCARMHAYLSRITGTSRNKSVIWMRYTCVISFIFPSIITLHLTA